jgi:hypothetical protein
MTSRVRLIEGYSFTDRSEWDQRREPRQVDAKTKT